MDSSYLPLKKVTKKYNELKNPNKLWLYVFHNLLHYTNKPEEFLSFIQDSPLHDFFSNNSSKFTSIPEHVHFSLDETLSSTQLTPFHLSSIDCTTFRPSSSLEIGACLLRCVKSMCIEFAPTAMTPLRSCRAFAI